MKTLSVILVLLLGALYAHGLRPIFRSYWEMLWVHLSVTTATAIVMVLCWACVKYLP